MYIDYSRELILTTEGYIVNPNSPKHVHDEYDRIIALNKSESERRRKMYAKLKEEGLYNDNQYY